jgi:hypothetical protein
MTSLAAARFELDKLLIAAAAENGGEVPLVSRVRFFLVPDPTRRWALCCAERCDGGEDIQLVFELPLPVDPPLDEDAMEQWFFSMPSNLRH